MAARAFSTNPLTMAIFRGQQDNEHRQATMFKVLLGYLPGQVFIAEKDEQVRDANGRMTKLPNVFCPGIEDITHHHSGLVEVSLC